jgi:hypothetical protein
MLREIINCRNVFSLGYVSLTESDVFLSICEEKCSYLIRLSYVTIKEDKL